MDGNPGQQNSRCVGCDAPYRSWQRGRQMVKRIGAVVATVVMTALLSAPAFAGSWTSHFAGWGIGDQSRNWTDSNSASNSTVLSIKQCTYSVTTAEKWMAFRLYRDDFWTPDETYERKGVDCW